MKDDDIVLWPHGPGTYEVDCLRLPTEGGKRVVAVRRRDVSWLLEVLYDYRRDGRFGVRDPLGYFVIPASLVGICGFIAGAITVYLAMN
jgi:hypothetical protein